MFRACYYTVVDLLVQGALSGSLTTRLCLARAKVVRILCPVPCPTRSMQLLHASKPINAIPHTSCPTCTYGSTSVCCGHETVAGATGVEGRSHGLRRTVSSLLTMTSLSRQIFREAAKARPGPTAAPLEASGGGTQRRLTAGRATGERRIRLRHQQREQRRMFAG